MSLNDIELPSYLIPDMYKRSLVKTSIDDKRPDGMQPPAWPYLGQNEKSVLLIVDNNDIFFLHEDDLNFLTGVLKACQLSLADVSLVNYANCPGLHYEGIAKQFSPSKIIFFGVEPASLNFPLSFPQYKLQRYNGQVYLYVPSLSILAAQKDQKILLWGSLKTLFNIK